MLVRFEVVCNFCRRTAGEEREVKGKQEEQKRKPTTGKGAVAVENLSVIVSGLRGERPRSRAFDCFPGRCRRCISSRRCGPASLLFSGYRGLFPQG